MMKLYTIKITEKTCLWVDVAAETEEEAMEAVQRAYEDEEFDQMRRECDAPGFEIVEAE